MPLKSALLLLFIPYVLCGNPLSVDKPFPDSLGINIHVTHPQPGELKMIREAGFKWVRMDFRWEDTEKVKGVYNFTDYEYLQKELVKNNMSAYFILDYGNKLYGEKMSVVTEAGRKAYAKWCATALQYFKGKGIVWEIWNEPNSNFFWNPHSNATQFVEMALEAMKEIRSKAPNEIVVGPTTSQMDLFYLEVCLRSGLLQYWDAVSVHPYRDTPPETTLRDFFALRQMIDTFAPKGKHIPIISSEWGYSSAHKCMNDTKQGKLLQRELLSNAMYGLPISIFYAWHNDGAGSNWGIVKNEYQKGKTPVYEPKESYNATKNMNTVLKGCKFVHRISTNDSNDYVLLFRNEKNELRLTAWSSTATIEKVHNISLPSDKCDFDIIHHLGTPVQKTTSSDGKVILSLNDLVHFIVPKCNNNKALEKTPDYNEFDIDLMPSQGTTLSIKLTHVYGGPQNGTIRLSDVKGLEPTSNEINFTINNELEKTIELKLKSKPSPYISLGLSVELGGRQNLSFGQVSYNQTSEEFLNDCIGHTVSVQSAPEKLFGSDIKALKVDYHLNGRKFMTINPKSVDNRRIPGEPKSVSFWVYGDRQSMLYKLKISAADGQVFQLRPLYAFIDWKGWRYVTIKMTDIETHWGGTSHDGHIRYPVELNALFLLENHGESEVNGTLFISSPIIGY